MNTKKCLGCKLFLDLSNYYKRSSAKDGHSSYCKDCAKKMNKKSYANNKNNDNISYRKPTEGNSLADKFPLIVENWDYDNNTVSPHEIMPSISAKMYWKCKDCNYSWEERVNSRTKKGNTKYCPNCAGKIPVSLEKSHPEYVNWWNDKRDISKFSHGSNVKIEWKCEKGHVFIQPIKRFKAKCKQCEIEEKSLKKLYPDLAKEFSQVNSYNSTEITYNSARTVSWECEFCEYKWDTKLYQRVNSSTGCPKCCKKPYGKAEKELVDFLKEKLGDKNVIAGDKKVLNGKELDIYIPDKNIAIEFNGLYWHTEEMGRDNKYHYKKWKDCYDKNIQLISIWEDDWINKKDIVKSSLLHKLGHSDSDKMFARKTRVKEITIKEAKTFCNKNHIQGFTSGTFYIGLIDKNNELVALSIWRKNKNNLYLDRYCTNKIVIGGMGKLLKHAINLIKHNNEKNSHEFIDKIVTFSDNAISNGSLYEKLGFILDKEIAPDYSYVVNRQRVHKFNYRLSRFKKDNNLKYFPNMTEKELAKINNIPRIWDCGKKRWIINIKKQ